MIAVLAQTVTQSASSLIFIAAIAGVCAVLAATIPIVANGRANRKMQAANWEREDKVAARVEAAAEAALEVSLKLSVDNAELRARTDEVAAHARLADEKLTKIVHQTDGLFTTALESELQALIGQVTTLREVIALRQATDSQLDNARALQVIESSEQKIDSLQRALSARKKYQDSLPGKPLAERLPEGPVEVTIVNPDPVDVTLREPPKNHP